MTICKYWIWGCQVYPTTQRAQDAKITSWWRQNEVVTSFWRHNDVIIASCARWEGTFRIYTFHCDTNLVWLTLTFITAGTVLCLSLFIYSLIYSFIFAKYILASIKTFGTWTHRHLGDVAIFTQWNRTYWVLQLLSGDRLESMSTTVRMAIRIQPNWLPSHLVMSRLSTRPPVSVYQGQNLSHSPFIYKSLKYNIASSSLIYIYILLNRLLKSKV